MERKVKNRSFFYHYEKENVNKYIFGYGVKVPAVFVI